MIELHFYMRALELIINYYVAAGGLCKMSRQDFFRRASLAGAKTGFFSGWAGSAGPRQEFFSDAEAAEASSTALPRSTQRTVSSFEEYHRALIA